MFNLRATILDFALGAFAGITGVAVRIGHALSFTSWHAAIRPPSPYLDHVLQSPQQVSWSTIIAFVLVVGIITALGGQLGRSGGSATALTSNRVRARSVIVASLMAVAVIVVYDLEKPANFPRSLSVFVATFLVLLWFVKDLVVMHRHGVLLAALTSSRCLGGGLLVLSSVMVGLVLLEILTRSFNPIPFRIKGHQIVRPINVKRVYTIRKIGGGERTVTNSWNSGPPPR